MAKNMENITGSAKKAMTTKGQKGAYVIDHIVEALGFHSSSMIRRAIVLIDIDQHEGTTQSEIMDRVDIDKSSLNRDIEWMFNHGSIRRFESQNDGRKIKLQLSAFAKRHMDAALDYFEGDHETLKRFMNGFIKIFDDEKATLREAKIFTTIYRKDGATRQDVLDSLYKGSPSTESRAITKLIEQGVIEDV